MIIIINWNLKPVIAIWDMRVRTVYANAMQNNDWKQNNNYIITITIITLLLFYILFYL